MVWLAGLGVFFYTSYVLANWLATQREQVPSIVSDWEHQIPFVAWTILPYWSVNLFYATSLFVCRTRAELDVHGRRLLTAQIIAVLFLIATPLAFSFAQSATTGIPGVLFTALQSFDRPYNQAPSLHIALLVILWALYGRHVPRPLRWPLYGWFALVGLSVLTTYQHHFFDIPTGALLGLGCLWLWPMGQPSPLAGARLATEDGRRRLALGYCMAGLVLAGASVALTLGLGLALSGAALWLLYPALALILVALNYALFGPAACWLPAPTTGVDWHCLPQLDLVAADPHVLRAAARRIEQARGTGNVLVVCALGYTRSASAVALWLVSTRRVADVDQAIALIQSRQPAIRLAHRRNSLAAIAAGRPDSA